MKDNILTVRRYFESLGLHVYHNRTGCPHWEHLRVFIPPKPKDGPNHRGTYVCVCKFNNKKLYNIKWHCSYSSTAPLKEYMSYSARWRIYSETGYYASYEQYKQMVHAAYGRRQIDLRAKLAAREKLNEEDLRKLKRIKKRSKVKGRSIQQCLSDVLERFIYRLNNRPRVCGYAYTSTVRN